MRMSFKSKIVVSVKRGFADIGYNWRVEFGYFKIHCVFDSMDVLFQFVDYLLVE